MNPTIAKLRPSSARLLLAFLAMQREGATYDVAIATSGITECGTLARAVAQLRDFGFLSKDAQGQECLTFPEPSRPARVEPRPSRVTDAKGW